MQWALIAELPPPLNADGPRVPDEGGAGVDPDQEDRWLGQVLPSVYLHAEPVVDEAVPEILLPLHRRFIGTAQFPLAGPLGHPAGDAAVLVGAAPLHLLACLLGVFLSLFAKVWRSLVGSSHRS